MASPDKLPGTYRVADGSKVAFGDAMATWVPLAYDKLIVTARRYHGVVTYLELSEHVQSLSGIRTGVLLPNWIGKLLEEVAKKAKALDEPPLTSLCVHQDGTIGPGYAQAPKSTIDAPGEDIEIYAAEHRLLCYRKYASDLPPDGGVPALTQVERERRLRNAKQIPAASPRCPECNIELPRSGICDDHY